MAATFAALPLLNIGSARATDDIDAAREHFDKGKRAYDIGHFEEAAREYELAYAAKDDPRLLFNLGQARRLAKQYSEAIIAYRAYLRNAPDAPNRDEVERHIAALQALQSKGPPSASQDGSNARIVNPAADQPRVSTSGRSASRPSYKKWWVWTVAAVAAGAVATAVAVGITQGQPHEPSYQVHVP